MEKSLIEEFGQDSVIDLNTGTVKSKEEVEAQNKATEDEKEKVEKNNEQLKKV